VPKLRLSSPNMKLSRSLTLFGLVGVAVAVVQDPCDPNNYEEPSVVSCVAGNCSPVDPDGQNGPLDPWVVVWDKAMQDFTNANTCHGCYECQPEVNTREPVLGLPAVYLPDCRLPNGFRSGQIAMENEPPFCLTVPSELSANSEVQVLIEAENTFDRICIQSIGSTITLNNGVTKEMQCGDGQVNACFHGENESEDPANLAAGDLKLMIFCDTDCPESNIAFKYKVLHSLKRTQTDIIAQDPAINNVDMWCMFQDGKDSTVWPSELVLLYPAGVEGPKDIDNGKNGASSASPSLIVAAIAVALALFH
jgi:hypothetical protein